MIYVRSLKLRAVNMTQDTLSIQLLKDGESSLSSGSRGRTVSYKRSERIALTKCMMVGIQKIHTKVRIKSVAAT